MRDRRICLAHPYDVLLGTRVLCIELMSHVCVVSILQSDAVMTLVFSWYFVTGKLDSDRILRILAHHTSKQARTYAEWHGAQLPVHLQKESTDEDKAAEEGESR